MGTDIPLTKKSGLCTLIVMTSIITTIGPASLNTAVLQHFATHSVRIARLNFSHNTADWHIRAGKICKEHGLDLMLDLAGPKVLLGTLAGDTAIATDQEIAIEEQSPDRTYPYEAIIDGARIQVFPCQFPIDNYLKNPQAPILINDGTIQLQFQYITNKRVIAHVQFGGVMKSNKGINLPGTEIAIDFLVERDTRLLSACLPALLPHWIAPSFVKSASDLHTLKTFLQKIHAQAGLPDTYQPRICTKIEMSEAVQADALDDIIAESDMVMVARGDLGMETQPTHIQVPFLQDRIVQAAHAADIEVVVATQMLESMVGSPVPNRAEMSDVYRAVHINKAQYIMLSAESAIGQFPMQCVQYMHDIIQHKPVR